MVAAIPMRGGRNPYRDGAGKFASKANSAMKAKLSSALKRSPALLAKAKAFISANKETILTEGAVVAAGVIGGKIGGAAVGSLSSATMRAAITVGKKAYSAASKAKAEAIASNGKGLMSIVKTAGAKFISDLKSPKFQRNMEKTYLGDLAYGAIATAVSSFVPIPLAGDAVALKTAGLGGKLASKGLQNIKKKVKAYRSARQNS
jgi:hypothetical protein